jgi:Secretion system C-terminal sorting domain
MKQFSILGLASTLVLLGTTAQAQDVYNSGAQITLMGGASIYVPGNLTNTGGGSISTAGSTVQVVGNVLNDAASTYTPGAGGVLEVKGNFTNTATLTPGAGTVLLSGTTTQALDLGGASLYNLTVNNTAGAPLVNVPSNVTVQNQLTLTNGMVRTLATSKVALPDGATVVGETNTKFVAGNLEVTRNSVSGGSPVDFGNMAAITPNNNLGQVVVTRTANLNIQNVSYGVLPTDNTKKSIDQIWTIVAASQPAVGNPASVTFSWLAANDNGAANFNQARVWKRVNSSAPWLAQGAYVNANSRSISAIATSFSDWTVSNSANPLPVELLTFGVVREGDAARLTWRTASERNNDHWDIQVSTDSREFRKFAEVAGQGSKTSSTDYTLLDPALLRYRAQVVYYRLHQVDTDGTEAFSPVQSLAIDTKGFAAMAFPNPVTSEGTQIEIRTATAGAAQLAVYDATGRLLTGVKTELQAGLNQVELREAGKLASGVYFLYVTQGSQRTMIKLVHE